MPGATYRLFAKSMLILCFYIGGGCVQKSKTVNSPETSPGQQNTFSGKSEPVNDGGCGFYLYSGEYFNILDQMKTTLNKTEGYWVKSYVDGGIYSREITAPTYFGSVNEESAVGRFNKAWNKVEQKSIRLQKLEESIDRIVRYRLKLDGNTKYEPARIKELIDGPDFDGKAHFQELLEGCITTL